MVGLEIDDICIYVVTGSRLENIPLQKCFLCAAHSASFTHTAYTIHVAAYTKIGSAPRACHVHAHEFAHMIHMYANCYVQHTCCM